MGRPLLPRTQKRGRIINLYLTIEEKKIVVHAARAAGLPPATFARLAVLKEAQGDQHATEKDVL